MLLGAVYYDMHAGSKPIPAKLMKVIKKDKTAAVLFDALLERTYAGSKEWINRHHSQRYDDIYDEEEISINDANDEMSERKTEAQINYEKLSTDDDLPF